MSTVHREFDIRGQLTLISLTVGTTFNGYPERNYCAGSRQEGNTLIFVLLIVVLSETIYKHKEKKTIMDSNVILGTIEFGNICINFNYTLYIYKII